MNTTPLLAAQAETFPAPPSFPQPIPIEIALLSNGERIQAILDLFDAGAISAALAEDWLTSLETSDL